MRKKRRAKKSKQLHSKEQINSMIEAAKIKPGDSRVALPEWMKHASAIWSAITDSKNKQELDDACACADECLRAFPESQKYLYAAYQTHLFRIKNGLKIFS